MSESELTLREEVERLRASNTALTERIVAMTELERGSARVKSEFLANMSHEIRTPMHGVLGVAELLLESVLGGPQRRLAQMMQTSAKTMLTLLDDILDLAKLEAGHIELEQLDLDPREVVDDALELVAQRAEAKGIELVAYYDVDVPARVRGDRGRLRQILTNLVGNAIKFTEHGKVEIRVRAEGDDGSQVALCFEVVDTGIGLAGEIREQVFGDFAQADGSSTRRYGGTGLGLAIVRRLIDAMHGSTGVDSELGVGSRFWVRAAFSRAESVDSAPCLRGLRVLLADEHETTRHALARVLLHEGMRVTTVRTAEDTRALLENARARYDAVLVDSGFLQLLPAMCSQPTVVLHPLGFAGVLEEGPRRIALARPCRRRSLLHALASVTRRQPSQPVPTLLGWSASARRQPRVLVAEDHPINQQIAVAMLERLGCSVVVVADGRAALEAIEREPFALVFMDWHMPEMDGLQATSALRARESAEGRAHLPVVALTASVTAEERARCLQAGLDGFVSKPFVLEDLRAVLQRWLPPPSSRPALDRSKIESQRVSA